MYVQEHVEKPKENLKKQDLGEKMATGALNSQVYWEYFKIGNSPIGLFLLISICASAQVAISATEFWMSFWYRNLFRMENNPMELLNLKIIAGPMPRRKREMKQKLGVMTIILDKPHICPFTGVWWR